VLEVCGLEEQHRQGKRNELAPYVLRHVAKKNARPTIQFASIADSTTASQPPGPPRCR
jgi:hypothetical protein